MRDIRHVDIYREALAHFGLKKDPFYWLPEKPSDYFYSTSMGLTEIALWQTIERPGICALFGEVGVGKSSAVRRYVEYNIAPKKKYVVSWVDIPQLRRVDMHHICQKILIDIKGDLPYGANLLKVAEAVRSTMEELSDEGVRPVLIIEDAHLLSVQSLRELKLLYELRRRIKHILAIVLIGQPELGVMLAREDMRQLAQRCKVERVQGLKADIVPYIKHRFKKIQAEATDFFEIEALKELVAHPTINTPLEVHSLCATALNEAWKLGEARVTRDLMFAVLSAHRDELEATARPAAKAQPAADGKAVKAA